MNNDVGNVMQWLQLIVTVVGLLSVFIQIGNKQGKQEEKNRNFENTLEIYRDEMDTIKTDIGSIKTDVAYIKGKLL